MQLPPDAQEFIRRAFHVEGKAIRQIDRVLLQRKWYASRHRRNDLLSFS
jgi:hypothetical protein